MSLDQELELMNKVIMSHKTIKEIDSICECMKCDICNTYHLSEPRFNFEYKRVNGYVLEIKNNN